MNLESYVDKIFFYCIKRCNNRFDAEDLAQTILTEVYYSLMKNQEVSNLESYIFKIAHNQYAKYVKQKVIERNNIDYDYDLNNINHQEGKLDKIIQNENLENLLIQLKTLSSDYLNIIYRYYVEDLKLSTIAEELNLPLGTVKRKLFEIRKKLKESLEMKILNGKKTYIPESYLFTMSCSRIGLYNPHDYVKTLIQENLLYHSYNNPCTLEDYSIELGISMPYIKDLVKTLEQVTLLKKIDGKYVTNFAFLSKEFQKKIYDILRTYKETFGKSFIKLATDSLPKFKEIGFSNSTLPDNVLLWNYIMILLLTINEDAKLKVEYSNRPGAGKWDFLGHEVLDEKNEFVFIGFNYNGNLDCVIHEFEFFYPNIVNRIKYNRDFDTLRYLYSNNIKNIENVKPEFMPFVQNLVEEGLISITNGEIKINCMIFSRDEFSKLKELLNSSDLSSLVVQYKQIFEILAKEVKEYLPSYLENQVNYIVFSLICDVRSLVFNVAFENNLLDECLDEKRFIHNFHIILTK